MGYSFAIALTSFEAVLERVVKNQRKALSRCRIVTTGRAQ